MAIPRDPGAPAEHAPEPNEREASGSPVPFDVVVVAAGASRRMGGLDKLEARLAGRPLLARTLDAVAAASGVQRIVLVAAAERVEELRHAVWLPVAVTAVVAGGERRQVSVAAGVAALDALDALDGGPDAAFGERVVLIHDGARPLVSPDLLVRVALAAHRDGAAIPVLPVADTVKRLDGDRVVATVDRRDLATAQTPQGFRRAVLAEAYARRDPAGSDEWTDEAALLESCSMAVHVVPGDPANLKVTMPADVARAQALLDHAPIRRVGLGQDSHPFGPGEPLVLGGVEIAGAPRLHGHSDGDVVLHAVADALLGAAGMGDLGRLYPAGPSTPRGIASRELVAGVMARLRDADLRPTSVDVTVSGARPRLGDRLDAMRSAIAELLDLSPVAVGVKASTGNLAGEEGAGRVISAQAIAVVEVRR